MYAKVHVYANGYYVGTLHNVTLASVISAVPERRTKVWENGDQATVEFIGPRSYGM